MGRVSAILGERFRSARQVGAAKPTARVTVTPGVIGRHYAKFESLGGDGTERNPEVFGEIYGGNNEEPWQAYWKPQGEPKELPNVFKIKLVNNFGQKGCWAATVEVENIIYKAISGVGGIYHAIMRGYLSPWRGLNLIERVYQYWEENEWFEVLDNGWRIDIWQGYGDELCHTFAGFITESEFETFPDRVVITARDIGGIVFTDQRLMGQVKAPEIKPPFQAADREKILGVELVGSGAAASGEEPGYPVGNIVKQRNQQPWESPPSEGIQWVAIEIPEGYYEEALITVPCSYQSVYLSIHAGAGSTWEGSPASGWVNAGHGEVPESPGIFVINAQNSSTEGSFRMALGQFQAAKGSAIRLSLGNPQKNIRFGPARSQVTRFGAFRFGTNPEHPVGVGGEPPTAARGWLLVDDASDVVKQIFLWGGFKEWRIEPLGFTLSLPLGWAMSETMMAVIEEIEAQANWVFFMETPTEDEESMGRPVFGHNSATDPPPVDMLQVTDQDLLESVKLKLSLDNLPYIIRYRGNVAEQIGEEFEEDTYKRYNGTYYPPWSGAGPDITEVARGAGVRRQEFTVDPNLESDEDCLMAAIMAAMQYALEAYTCEIQISGYPGMELNDHISVIDKTTGFNSRVWVSEITSEQTLGKGAEWKMTVGGGVLDTPDMEQIKARLESVRAAVLNLKAAKDKIVGEPTI